MSPLFLFSILCLKFWTSVQGDIHESGEFVFQNVFRWNYTYMNPSCTDASGGRNPCKDARICRFATASIALGGWPTLCDWVGKGVPKVCCGLPLVLGQGLMKKVDEEISRKRECGTRAYSEGLSETFIKFFDILDSLPEVDISDPGKFDPPLDLQEKSMLVPPVTYTGSRQGDFPWMVSIRTKGSHVCGGSLIDRKHILTAAHCLPGNASQYAVHVGNLYVDDGYVFYVAKIKIHPEYQRGNLKNLAILTLSEEILSPLVPHICLPGPTDDNLVGLNATLLIWEMTNLDGVSEQTLRIMEGLAVIPTEECRSIYAKEFTAEELEEFICTKENQSYKGPCVDDYGGPLMSKDSSENDIAATARWTMIGVDTFEPTCERKKQLKLYTRISRNSNWILETTKD